MLRDRILYYASIWLIIGCIVAASVFHQVFENVGYWTRITTVLILLATLVTSAFRLSNYTYRQMRIDEKRSAWKRKRRKRLMKPERPRPHYRRV